MGRLGLSPEHAMVIAVIVVFLIVYIGLALWFIRKHYLRHVPATPANNLASS